jgi:hypothetical protein
MQKSFSVIPTLIVILLSGPAYAGEPPDESSSYTKAVHDRIEIGPALQLPLNTTAPLVCSADTQGTLALNAHAQLCLCAGEHWRLVNSDEPCTWQPAGQ